jgi:hypothetical protein
MIAALFGAYLGVIIDSLYLKGTSSKINKTSFTISLARVFVSLLPIILIIIPF